MPREQGPGSAIDDAECEAGRLDCSGSNLDGWEDDPSRGSSCEGCESARPFACGNGGECAVTTLTAGVRWTCATLSDRTARCWGNNSQGQLGTGDTNPTLLPREVVGLTDAERIAAAFGHTCAVRTGRLASCWGENDRGQLGDGTTVSRPVPVSVQLVLIDAITVGLANTCVRSGERLSCWGLNDVGQLGFGDTDNRPTPETVPQELVGRVVDVSAGLAHTCTVRRNGRVVCFGFNDQGQAGSGEATVVLVPALVPGLRNAVQIAAGNAHSCAVTVDGAVRCWGWNGSGQLGDGTFQSRFQPSFVIDEAGDVVGDIVRVVAGPRRTCATDSAGAGFCWGDNLSGALGAGPSAPAPQSPRALRVTIVGSERILDVAVGDRHTCFLTPSRVRCVGENGDGQLGDGTTNPTVTGVDVAF